MNVTKKIPATAKSVVFDLETSGDKECDILQIAARYKNSVYNAYIMPSHGIHKKVSGINGFEVKDSKLFKNSLPVSTVSPRVAIDALLKFLRSVAESIVLTAHGGFDSDARWIIKLVEKEGRLQDFKYIVHGFADTLPMLQNKLTERQRLGGNFKLATLAKEYLGSEAAKDAHDARCDTEILQRLLTHPDINITNDQILENAIPVSDFQFLITQK